MTEAIYQNLVKTNDASAPESIHLCSFPVCDETKLVQTTTEYVVQINSKIVGRFEVETNASKQQIEDFAKAAAAEKLAGKEILKAVVIPNKLVNFVCK